MSVRALSLVVIVLALGVAGYVFARQAETAGPTAQLVQDAKADATAGVIAVNFQQAVPVMESWFAANATYAGAVVPASYGVTVVRADAVSYCLQGGAPGAPQHLRGPGGALEPGPCS